MPAPRDPKPEAPLEPDVASSPEAAPTDEPVAKLAEGEVTFLEVTAVTRFGAFVDWGLPKELLVPFAEQTRDVFPGERHPIGLYVDNTGRPCGTMRVSEMLDDANGEFEQDEWVQGEAWRNDPDIGLFVILERACVGLVPAMEHHTMKRGEAGRFRVTNILPDGKIELSLRRFAHEEVDGDAQRILDALAKPGAAPIGDKSSPEEVRAVFGMSKKAFKRAVGKLFKERLVQIDAAGIITLAPPR